MNTWPWAVGNYNRCFSLFSFAALNWTWDCTYFWLACLAKKLQVLIAVLGLVFIDGLFDVIGDLGNSRGSRGAEYPLQLLVKFVLQLGFRSGGRKGRKAITFFSIVSQVTAMTSKEGNTVPRQIQMSGQKDKQRGRTTVYLTPHLFFLRKHFFSRLILVWHCSTVLM